MNRILGMVSAVLFALLLLACGYVYRQWGRLNILQQAMNETSPIMLEELEVTTTFYNKKIKRGIEEPSKIAFRPIYETLVEIRLDLDTLENSINKFQEEVIQNDYSKNALDKSIRAINDEIYDRQQSILAKYATMLRTYGESPIGLLDYEIEAILTKKQQDWRFYEKDWLLKQFKYLNQTDFEYLLSLISVKIKIVELSIIQDFTQNVNWRVMHCFWNSLNIHPRQCQVKLGETFEAEIGIAEYPIAIHPSKWSLTVDDVPLKADKYNMPIYEKKATRLGWQEFTVVYKTQSVLTGEPIEDKFTYRYEVVR